jgi:hypothetical protein
MLFPLVDSSYDNKEILRAISTLLSGQLTMGRQVKALEKPCGIGLSMAVPGDKEGLYK